VTAVEEARAARLRCVPWGALVELEAMVYEHACDAVDFDMLFQLEQALWFKLDDLAEADALGEFPSEMIHELADELVARALRAMPADPRRVATGRDGPERSACELCRLLAGEGPELGLGPS